MKTKRYTLLILFCLLGLGLSAQGLTQAKNYYAKGQYAKAKPIFKKLVRAQAANGNYNLWYGVCCLRTGEPELAVKHLEIAVKKRIPSGQLYLGQAYDESYRFEDATNTYEAYREELIKRKRSTEEVDGLLEKSRRSLRMLKGVEKVCFIDSIIVDKEEFLSFYKLSNESGTLCKYGEYLLDSEEQKDGTVYKTELGNKTYYGERQADGIFRLLTCDKMGDGWSTGTPLTGGIDTTANANFPYVMADGVTLYYASDGPASMGGYDIFVTRYNSATNSYLTPENVGMPFNSPYNDYMFVIDEFNNLGWFASDRYQPKDKVCLYVFIPNSSKQVYNYEGMETDALCRLARICSIKESWTDNNAVKEARRRLADAQKEVTETKKDYDFEFVIDDRHTYYYFTDFRSQRARNEFNNYRRIEKSYKQVSNKLENMRLQYAYASAEQKRAQTPSILDLEKRILTLRNEMHQSAITVRRLEKESLK